MNELAFSMTRDTLFRVGFGGAVVLGLTAAALWRAPEASPRRAVEIPPTPSPAPPPPTAEPPPSPAPVPAPAAPSAAAQPSGDEASLMVTLRSLRDSDPKRAIELASDGNRRFPESPDAPERAAILVHALVQDGRRSDARRLAEEMVNQYPDSSWVRDVELFTGAHRHRNIRINDAGGVEYY